MALDPIKVVEKFQKSAGDKKLNFRNIARNLIRIFNITESEDKGSKKEASGGTDNARYTQVVQALFKVFADENGDTSSQHLHEDMGNVLKDGSKFNEVHKLIEEGVKRATGIIRSTIKHTPTDRSADSVADDVFTELVEHTKHYLTEFRLANKTRGGGDYKIKDEDDIHESLGLPTSEKKNKKKHKKKRRESTRGAYVALGVRGLMEKNSDIFKSLESFYGEGSHSIPDENSMKNAPKIEIKVFDDAAERGADTLGRGDTFVPDIKDDKGNVTQQGGNFAKSGTKIALITRIGDRVFPNVKNPSMTDCENCTYVSSTRKDLGVGGEKTSPFKLQVGKTYELVFGPYSIMKTRGSDAHIMLKVMNDAHQHTEEELNLGDLEIPKFLTFAASTIVNALHKKGELSFSSEALSEDEEYQGYQNKSHEDLADIAHKSRSLAFQDDIKEALKGGDEKKVSAILEAIYADMAMGVKEKHDDPGIRDLLNNMSQDRDILKTNEIKKEIEDRFESIKSIVQKNKGMSPEDFIHKAAFSKEIVSSVLEVMLGDHSVMTHSKHLESVIKSVIAKELSDKAGAFFHRYVNTSHHVKKDGREDLGSSEGSRHNTKLMKDHTRHVAALLQSAINSNRSNDFREAVESRIVELVGKGPALENSLVAAVFRPAVKVKTKEAGQAVRFSGPSGEVLNAKTNINVHDFKEFFEKGSHNIVQNELTSDPGSLDSWWEVGDLTDSHDHIDEGDVADDISGRLYKSPDLKGVATELLDFLRDEIQGEVGDGKMKSVKKLLTKMENFTTYREGVEGIRDVYDLDDMVQSEGQAEGTGSYKSKMKKVFKELGMPTQEKIFKQLEGDEDLQNQFSFLPKPARPSSGDVTKGPSKYNQDKDLGVSKSDNVKSQVKKDIYKKASDVEVAMLIRSLMARA